MLCSPPVSHSFKHAGHTRMVGFVPVFPSDKTPVGVPQPEKWCTISVAKAPSVICYPQKAVLIDRQVTGIRFAFKLSCQPVQSTVSWSRQLIMPKSSFRRCKGYPIGPAAVPVCFADDCLSRRAGKTGLYRQVKKRIVIILACFKGQVACPPACKNLHCCLPFCWSWCYDRTCIQYTTRERRSKYLLKYFVINFVYFVFACPQKSQILTASKNISTNLILFQVFR